MPTTVDLLRLDHRSLYLDPTYCSVSEMAAAAATVDLKHRDPTWIPPPCSSSTSDLANDKQSNLSPHIPTTGKIGESFLSDIQSSVLNPHTTCTATTITNSNSATKNVKSSDRPDQIDNAQQSASPLPVPPSASEDERRFDSVDQPRDLQSDLFLLDQAMQPQPPSRQDPILHQTASSAINMAGELEASDSLFGDALGRSAFTQPLFDDHNKLLSFEGSVEAIPSTSQPYPAARLPSHPIVTSQAGNLSVLPNKSVSDSQNRGPEPLESILQELGVINSQQERDFNFARDNGFRSFPGMYGQDVHLPGSMTFGRQKKRRLASAVCDGGPIFSDGTEGPMAKRAKSEIPQSTGGLYYGERSSRPAYGGGIGGTRTGGRAYSMLKGLGMNRGGHGHYADGGPDMNTRTHTDLYENLAPELQMRVDHLREKIAKMPRRKLRESLAKGVTIDEVIPLMVVNRDDLAEMLGLGVTTWKIFIHNTFGIPRWPARVLKSQEMREKSLRARLAEAELRGDTHTSAELWQELKKLEEKRRMGRNKLRNLGRRCREKLLEKLNKAVGGRGGGNGSD